MSTRCLTLLCCAAILLATALCHPAPAQAEARLELRNLDFGTPRAEDYEAGGVALWREPLEYQADAAWRIVVESLDPTLGVSADGRYEKQLSDLQFKLSHDSQWYSLRMLPELIAQDSLPGTGALSVDWRILLDWERDRPGQYRARLRFTIESP